MKKEENSDIRKKQKVNHAYQIKDQRKAFCRKKNPQSSCARKVTVEMDILIASSNGNRKIIQPTRIISTTAVDPQHLEVKE